MSECSSPTGLVILIPSYKSRANLERHLPAALAEAERLGARVVVSDDASPDDTVERTRASFAGVTILTRKENGGFGENCNDAIERLPDAELIFLMNSDVDICPGALSPLLSALEDPRVFAAGAVAVDPKDGLVWDGVKRIHFSRGLPKFDKLDQSALCAPGENLPTLYAVGAHVLFRRADFLDLGGFDSLFAPYYWEDNDLCYRARKAGRQVLLVPGARVMHNREHGDIDRTQGAARVRHIIHRNRILFCWKNLHDPQILWGSHLLPLVVRVLTSWALLDWRFYRALGAALSKLGPALRSRRSAFRAASVLDRDVLKVL